MLQLSKDHSLTVVCALLFSTTVHDCERLL